MARSNISPNNGLLLVKNCTRGASVITFEPRTSPPDTILQDLEGDLKRLQVLLQQASNVLQNAQGRWFALRETCKNFKRGA